MKERYQMLLANDIDNGADEKDCLFIANYCRKHIESLGGGGFPSRDLFLHNKPLTVPYYAGR